MFLQRTFLSNFPQSLSAREHTTDIHHPLSYSRNLSSSSRCVYCALQCPHPHLTDCVRVCFTACVCERVTVCLVSADRFPLVMSLVTGLGALHGAPEPSHLPCPSCPGDQAKAGRGLTPTKHISLCVMTIHLNKWLHANISRTARNLIKEE